MADTTSAFLFKKSKYSNSRRSLYIDSKRENEMTNAKIAKKIIYRSEGLLERMPALRKLELDVLVKVLF